MGVETGDSAKEGHTRVIIIKDVAGILGTNFNAMTLDDKGTMRVGDTVLDSSELGPALSHTIMFVDDFVAKLLKTTDTSKIEEGAITIFFDPKFRSFRITVLETVVQDMRENPDIARVGQI
jgi:hypothetical protein